MRSLPQPPAALALRLLTRKRVWHALAGLDFPEVPDPAAAAAQLVEQGLAQWDGAVTRAAELRLLLEAVPADVLRGALLALLPGRHPALASGGGKAPLIAAAQVRAGLLSLGCLAWPGPALWAWCSACCSKRVRLRARTVLTPFLAYAQSAAPPPRVAAAVRSIMGPLLRMGPAAQRLFTRMQRFYFLSEGQGINA